MAKAGDDWRSTSQADTLDGDGVGDGFNSGNTSDRVGSSRIHGVFEGLKMEHMEGERRMEI